VLPVGWLLHGVQMLICLWQKPRLALRHSYTFELVLESSDITISDMDRIVNSFPESKLLQKPKSIYTFCPNVAASINVAHETRLCLIGTRFQWAKNNCRLHFFICLE